MIITEVRPFLLDRYLMVEIRTDEGLTGLGESGAWGFLEASRGALDHFGRYLVGKSPLLIEHHWQYLYRSTHFRGAAIMGALSAIDIALWDIAGQHHGVPVHHLLGGPVRDRARAYCHVFGQSRAELIDGIVAAKEQGFTAVGHLTPFLDSPRDEPYFETEAQKIGRAIEAVHRYREVAGDGVDLCIELHRRLTPAEAVLLGSGIEAVLPMFLEDPVLPDNLDEMAYVADKIKVPIATGERLTSIWDFEMLLSRNAVQYVRPDVCLVGGISGAKKIAALAEARHVGVVPHNPLGPVSTAACLQIAASVSNFALQEFPTVDLAGFPAEAIEVDYGHDGRGFLTVPNTPGIGARLGPDAERLAPPRIPPLTTRLHLDGSVVDQ